MALFEGGSPKPPKSHPQGSLRREPCEGLFGGLLGFSTFFDILMKITDFHENIVILAI